MAQIYINKGAIPKSKLPDALHIAVATLAKMDILISWNCAHIVKYKIQRIVKEINLNQGLKDIFINTPREIIS